MLVPVGVGLRGPLLDGERRAVATFPVKPNGLPARLFDGNLRPGSESPGAPSHQAVTSRMGDGAPFTATVASR
jgi:hypothetical protein